MKKLLVLSLIGVTLLSCQKSDNFENCIDPSLIDDEIGCTLDYNPVCGCDGVTYSNACVAKYGYGVTMFTKGACNCSYEYTGQVVDYTGLDGCGLMILLSDNTLLEPVHVPSGFTLKAGMNLELNYREITTHASICMAGKLADIVCVREADSNCNPIILFPTVANKSSDPVTIKNAYISGDCLNIGYSHSGGCAEHNYELELQPFFCGTPPLPPGILVFSHFNKGDMCEALVSGSISYDLQPLQIPDSSKTEFYLRDQEGNYSQKFTYYY